MSILLGIAGKTQVSPEEFFDLTRYDNLQTGLGIGVAMALSLAFAFAFLFVLKYLVENWLYGRMLRNSDLYQGFGGGGRFTFNGRICQIFRIKLFQTTIQDLENNNLMTLSNTDFYKAQKWEIPRK